MVIALLKRADSLLSGFDAITVLADRAFPSGELLGWFEVRSRWSYVMRLRAGNSSNQALQETLASTLAPAVDLLRGGEPRVEVRVTGSRWIGCAIR